MRIEMYGDSTGDGAKLYFLSFVDYLVGLDFWEHLAIYIDTSFHHRKILALIILCAQSVDIASS